MRCFNGKFRWQLFENIFAKAIDDAAHGVFGPDAALLKIKQLFFGNFYRRGFVAYCGLAIAYVDLGQCGRGAVAANEHGVALGEVVCANRRLVHLDQASVGVVRDAG